MLPAGAPPALVLSLLPVPLAGCSASLLRSSGVSVPGSEGPGGLVCGVAKSWTRLSNSHTYTHTHTHKSVKVQ